MKCPYCGHAMEMPPHHFPLSDKRGKVLNLVISAGTAGISREYLADALFKDRKAATIRTTIHNINNSIRPWRITTIGGRYRLVKY